MIVVNDRGFHKGYAVADWGCPTCRRIVLTTVLSGKTQPAVAIMTTRTYFKLEG